MGTLNTRDRSQAANTTFHVYNRGLDKRRVFIDDADRREFLDRFRRYLGPGEFCDRRGRPYANHSADVCVLAYCLMPNHFHFVIHQTQPFGMAQLLKAAIGSYVKYFNARHRRSGALFSPQFRAIPKHDPHQIQTAIAYVHLNHPDGATYEFSTHNAYTGATEPPDWVDIKTGLAVFGNQARYERFIAEYAQGA